MINARAAATVLAGLGLLAAGTVPAADWSGQVALEGRWFADAPLDPAQHGNAVSLALEPELVREFEAGGQLSFKAFARLDQHDDERTHVDLRELQWLTLGEDWELRAGVSKVFWGVTESRHLVDIVNQTDGVENLDGEDKLGQPMLQLSLLGDQGNLELFVLPYFRERTFAGESGRPRGQPRVDPDLARYAEGGGRDNLDLALRWSTYRGIWDIGLSLFHGTGRDPRLEPTRVDGEIRLAPVYVGIDQFGLDLQATLDAWLWKLEAIHRDSDRESFTAAVAGFEHTLYGVADTAWDLGLLAEYLYDERGDQADTPFQDDLFLGLRLAANDAQSSELLAGVIADLGQRTRFYNLEASRRLGEHWTATLELRWLEGTDPADPLHGLRDDDHLRLELARHF